MRKNEHPRCGCRSCRRGASSTYGKTVHRAVNRQIRHITRMALRSLALDDLDTFDAVIVSTTYTD
jgi:RNase P protein component